jgi:hypothetical protein
MLGYIQRKLNKKHLIATAVWLVMQYLLYLLQYELQNINLFMRYGKNVLLNTYMSLLCDTIIQFIGFRCQYFHRIRPLSIVKLRQNNMIDTNYADTEINDSVQKTHTQCVQPSPRTCGLVQRGTAVCQVLGWVELCRSLETRCC